MKRIFLVFATLILMVGNSFALITVTKPTFESSTKNQMVITLACVAAADGTFTALQLTESNVGAKYWAVGYYLYEVIAINPASDYATDAAAVTIADEDGVPILKSGELALSTSASGVSEATIAKYRGINKKVTVTIGDSGSAANTVTLILKLGK
jgi:hypothetical protein